MAWILIVDDNPECRSILRRLFEQLRHRVDEASDGRTAVSRACSAAYNLVVLDLSLPKLTGIRALKAIKDECPDLPVIAIGTVTSIDTAIQAVKLGADSYVMKPLNVEEIQIVAGRALERRRLVSQNRCLVEDLKERYSFTSLVGANPSAREAYALAQQAAETDAAVLIIGETGTGKEYLARAIHYASSRAGGPFVKVNCATTSEAALDGELFGCEKGSASGRNSRHGRLECADGGTIFFDEIARISPALQTKLVRAAQRKQWRRVGGSELLTSDVRVIAATEDNASERRASEEDLCGRLGAVTIALPALRDRRDDIPGLAESFVRRYAVETSKPVSAISDAAIERLVAHEWRGNIRELENCIERSVILCGGDSIGPEHLVVDGINHAGAKRKQKLKSLREIEREHIKKVLIYCNWNRSVAASILEIDRKTVRCKMREFGLVPPGEE